MNSLSVKLISFTPIFVLLLSFVSFSQEKEIIEKLEKRYGPQWDFCKCVFEIDSMNNVISQEKKLSERELEEFYQATFNIERKCMAFHVLKQLNTPDERKEHEIKVNECLNRLKE